MAEFTTPEEFEKELERARTQLEAGWISQKQYNDILKDAKAGVQGYTASLRQSMAQLGTSFKDMGKSIYDGKQGAATYNSTLSAGADAVSSYAAKFGPAGKAVALFTQVVVGFVNAALKQSDALYDSYAKISRTGTVGSQAMGEVFDQMKSFGYTVEQLGDMGELLGKNSKNFGIFAKSALEGARSFGDVANQIQNSPIRQQFFALGLSVNDINDGIAGYMNQQGKLGQLQGKTTKDLAQSAQDYIKELDAMTKLTGMTRQEQEDAREAALQIDAFYASLADLGEEQQEEALKVFTYYYNKGGEKTAAAMVSGFSGAITGSTDAIISTGGVSMQLMNKSAIQAGAKFEDITDGINKSLQGPMKEATKNVEQFGGSIGLNLRTMNNITGAGGSVAKIMEKINKEQKNQLDGINPATKAQAGLRDSQIKSSQNMAEFTNLGVNGATRALEIFTDVVEGVTSMLPGATEAKKRRLDMDNAKKAPTSTKVWVGDQLVEAGSQEEADAKAGKKVAPKAGGGGGGGGGYVAPVTGETDLSGGGDEVDNSKKPAAGAGGLFKGQSLNGVSPALVAALTQAVTAYGKPITITSGVRSKEEQQKLYDDWISGKSKFPAAKPGNSKHEGGNAVDISLADADALASGGYLKAAGLGRPVDGDPVHIQQVSAANGAILSGPSSGYKPNLTMHGTEAVVPLNTAAQQAAAGGGMDSSLVAAQLDKLDEMISIMKNQLGVQTKQMQLSS